MQRNPIIKCVVVGDGAVGKTSLLISYSQNVFIEEHVPTILDEYITTVSVCGIPYDLLLFDTAGQEDFDHLRPIAYNNTNVFVVCFSLVDRSSFKHVEEKWLPEIIHHCQNVKFLLVGTKSDLRDEYSEMFITTTEGRNLANRLGAVKYIECSSRTRQNVKTVFDDAIRASFKVCDKNGHACCNLS